ncbi:hypothetical protein COJ41_00500 [Bacillus thuringiensis]|uniref:hypothetical protein n=1 Tax=Bacillus thuringiensis TaxID=1428 RepID=UPI000BF6F925|nr:hypothetical protein [Bacillus thuringiensis]PEW37899.1 hypothetical protein CN444_28645 [Bacillus thuringiensis]PEY66228.1 hypothetical protein CN352_09910 [Bacillus thuringiensis]PFK10594.1 hypothetical protein COJ17_17915 [Bacillus thuringiensis]PFM26053.1 hypothetical protein COJ41_00500 [Bacillus thuringiensis]
MKKKFIALMLFSALLLPASVSLAGSYSNWYEINAGMKTPFMDMGANKTVKVTTSPLRNDAGSGARVYLYLEKQTTFGFDVVSESWNYADRYDTSTQMKTTSKSGKYRVYFRNYTGNTMKANFTINF